MLYLYTVMEKKRKVDTKKKNTYHEWKEEDGN